MPETDHQAVNAPVEIAVAKVAARSQALGGVSQVVAIAVLLDSGRDWIRMVANWFGGTCVALTIRCGAVSRMKWEVAQ